MKQKIAFVGSFENNDKKREENDDYWGICLVNLQDT